MRAISFFVSASPNTVTAGDELAAAFPATVVFEDVVSASEFAELSPSD